MRIFEVVLNIFCVMIWPQADGCQGVECVGFNEKCPLKAQTFEYLAGAVWGSLGDASLLEEVCNQG